MNMKKTLAITLAAVTLLGLAACSKTQPAVQPASTQKADVQIQNPWTDYESPEAAEAAVGYEITIPESISGCSDKQYRAMEQDGDTMLEVIYAADSEAETEAGRVRKAPGSEDISGDYNEYAEQQSMTVGSVSATCKGEGGLVKLAIWTDGVYAYSMSVSQPQNADAWAQIVKGVQVCS